MGMKLVDRIKVFATAAGGVPIALAEAFAAGPAVGKNWLAVLKFLPQLQVVFKSPLQRLSLLDLRWDLSSLALLKFMPQPPQVVLSCPRDVDTDAMSTTCTGLS